MVVGSLVILSNCQTTGYYDGEVGIITKMEPIGELFMLYWIYMSNGTEVPMWDVEFKELSEGRGSSNSCNGIS